VLHAKALHGNPFDGHTLGPVITELERQTGVTTRRIHVDKGYRGHNHKEAFRVWISGQLRRVTRPIRREMKRRAAVEPVIGHTKAEHRLGRNYLKGRDGDCINAVLAAAGYNFGLLLRWLARLLRALFQAHNIVECSLRLKTGATPFFTGDSGAFARNAHARDVRILCVKMARSNGSPSRQRYI